MIYLKRKNIVFIKPRKVAGTSFEIALSKFADDKDDILTPLSTADEELRSTVGGG